VANVQCHLQVEAFHLKLVAGVGNTPCKASADRMQMKETGTLTKTLACHEKKKADGCNLAYGQPAFFCFFSFNSCEQRALDFLDNNSIRISSRMYDRFSPAVKLK